jgi:hypothetical protein
MALQFKPDKRVPEIIVFEHVDFGGREFRTNLIQINDLGSKTNETYTIGVTGGKFPNLIFSHWNMNDKISSIIVVSGVWQFYRDNNFKVPLGQRLPPGYYNWVENILISPTMPSFKIPNDQISSFECVEQTLL